MEKDNVILSQSKSQFPLKSIHPNDLAVWVENVAKSYGSNQPVLQNISMHVEKGIVYGLLGSSGCGKTTLLSCIVGLKTWETGRIHVFGKNVVNNVSLGQVLGYMPQDLALYDQLSVLELIKYYGKLYGMSGGQIQEKIKFLVKLLKIPNNGTSLICRMSGGQKRRVSLALTLVHEPKLLILDEPTVGLDPLLRMSIWNHLYNLSSKFKTTIIITTHYIEEVRKAHKVGLMRNGKLLVEENPMSLMNSYQASLLEDVVLQICRKDQNHGLNSLTSHNETVPQDKNLESVQVLNPVKFNSSWKKFTSRNVNEMKEFYGTNGKFIEANADSFKVNKIEETSGESETVSDESCRFTCVNHSLRSIQRTLAFSQVIWINFIRHPVFIFLILLLPSFQLFTTGIVIGTEPKGTSIGIVNKEIPTWKNVCREETLERNMSCDLSMLSCDFIQHLYTHKNYILPVQYLTVEEALTAVQQGHISGYIQIPDNYSEFVVERAVQKQFSSPQIVDGSTITMHMDMSPFITMFFMLTNLVSSFETFIQDLTSACDFNLQIAEIPFSYKTPVYGRMDSTAREYALPSMIVGILFEISFGVTPLIFINDMRQGTLQRAMVAGLGFAEMILGILLTVSSITILQVIICYISLEGGLNFAIQGNVLLYGLLCYVTALCGGTLGLFIGIVFVDFMIIIIGALVILPVLMLYCGMLRPVEVIPPYLRTMSYLFPSSSIVEPFRSVMSRGLSINHPTVWPGILITLGWAAIFCVGCLIYMRKLKK